MQYMMKGPMAILAIVLLVCTLPAPALCAHSNEWPQFRANSQNTGASDGIAPRTGSVLWSYNIGDPTSSSPTVADEKLFIGDNNGMVWALDAITGEFLWSYQTGGPVQSTPTYLDGKIYVGSDDTNLTALDAANGKLLWKFKTNGTVKSSVSVGEYNDAVSGTPKKVLVFGSYDSNLYGLDLDGKMLWSFRAASFIHGKPGIYDGKAFTCTCDRTLYGIDIETGDKAFNVSFGDYSAASPSAADGFVYGTTRGGKVFAVSLSNGTIKWEVDMKKITESSPAVAEGLVVVGNSGNEVLGINASNGNKVWTFQANGGVDSSAAIVDDMVFFGDGSAYMHALNATSGQEIWSFHSNGVIDSSPAVAYGMVFFGTLGGTIYALGDKNPQVRILSPRPWQTFKTSFTVQFEAYGKDLTSVEVGVDGANWTKAVKNTSAGPAVWEAKVEIKKLYNTEHELTVRATNNTGVGEASIYFIVKKPHKEKPFLPGLDFPTTIGALIFVTVTIRMLRLKFPGRKER